MAKGTVKLANGTVVTIEGTTEEIHTLLALYSGEGQATPRSVPPRRAPARKASVKRAHAEPTESVNHAEIVNLAKTSDEAEAIEANILDRSSQVDRVLLPLYLVHNHLGDAFGLNSTDISKITTELGVPVSQANASKTLAGTASKYVMGDKVRKRGRAVYYRLTRRGVQYLRSVLNPSTNG